MRYLLLVTLSLLVGSRTLAEDEQPDVARLLQSLGHADARIRLAAARDLADRETDATKALVDRLLAPNLDARQATFTTLILRERLTQLGRQISPEGELQFAVPAAERAELTRLADALQSGAAGEEWRWYLLATLVDDFAVELFAERPDVLVAALREPRPMQQFAAVRSIFHLGSQAGAEAKSALQHLLVSPRRPFHGIYLRDNSALQRNAIAFAVDNRVYQNDTPRGYFGRRFRFYGNDDLLICDALIAVGATFDDVGRPLAALASSDHASTRLHAARLLVQVGQPGQAIAAETLNAMLVNDDPLLLRRLADEHPSFVAEIAEDQNGGEASGTLRLFGQLESAAGRTLPGIIHALRNEDVRVRTAAATLVAQVGATSKEEAVAALQRAIRSEELVGGPSLDAMVAALQTLESSPKNSDRP